MIDAKPKEPRVVRGRVGRALRRAFIAASSVAAALGVVVGVVVLLELQRQWRHSRGHRPHARSAELHRALGAYLLDSYETGREPDGRCPSEDDLVRAGLVAAAEPDDGIDCTISCSSGVSIAHCRRASD